MSTTYSIQSIQESWNTLSNPASSPEMRSIADKFLIEFKVNLNEFIKEALFSLN